MIYGRNLKGLRRAISATVLLIGLGVVSGPPRSVAAEAGLDTIPTPPIFQNPFMAANNFSAIHFNSFQTDTTSVSGPARASSQTVQQGLLRPIAQIAGTIAFNSRGQILTVRVGPSETTPGEDTQTLLLIHPVTLQVLAETDLPPRPSSGGRVSFAGGGILLYR